MGACALFWLSFYKHKLWRTDRLLFLYFHISYLPTRIARRGIKKEHRLIGSTLVFGIRGPQFKSKFSCLSLDPMIAVYVWSNSWLCKVSDSGLSTIQWADNVQSFEYSGDPKSDPSKTGNIQKPDVFVSGFRMVNHS